MNRKLYVGGYVGVTFAVVLLVLGVGEMALERAAAARGDWRISAPSFQVDPMWPKAVAESLDRRTDAGSCLSSPRLVA